MEFNFLSYKIKSHPHRLTKMIDLMIAPKRCQFVEATKILEFLTLILLQATRLAYKCNLVYGLYYCGFKLLCWLKSSMWVKSNWIKFFNSAQTKVDERVLYGGRAWNKKCNNILCVWFNDRGYKKGASLIESRINH